MTNVKRVVLWEPKRVEKGMKNGQSEYVGKFRTKVKEGTPRAVRHTGQNAAGKSWDYWGVDVDSINGVVRWIDVRDTDYGWKLVLFLETEKQLNQITTNFDVNDVHKIVNHLCGLRKELATAHINISYWVRMKKNAKGEVKTDDKGKILWAKDFYFRDVPELFSFDEWKEYSEKHGLQWFQEVRNGSKEWNYTAELNFWLSKIVGIQRYLLTTDTCLPFCWNSVTACESPSPGGNLTAAEIAQTQSVYEAIKPLYAFPFSKGFVSGDDVALDPEQGYVAGQTTQTAQAAKADPAMVGIESGFPTQDLSDYENNTPDNEFDDLPF